MRVALVNPHWTFDGSIYFGCREPHLPLELGYCRALLERDGHRVLHGRRPSLRPGDADDVAEQVAAFRPDMTVVTTAPTYLFWRCAPPELRVPREFLARSTGAAAARVAVGPHGSTTPGSALAQARRRCRGAGRMRGGRRRACAGGGLGAASPGPRMGRRASAPVHGGTPGDASSIFRPLHWPDEWVAAPPSPPSPLRCRPGRPGRRGRGLARLPLQLHLLRQGSTSATATAGATLGAVLAEIDAAVARRVSSTSTSSTRSSCRNRPLLEALVGRGLKFGVQTRIDLWKPEMLELLGAGGLRLDRGRRREPDAPRAATTLAKNCRLSTDELAERLIAGAAARAVRAGEPARDGAGRRRRWSTTGASGCSAAASGPTTRCRCSLSRARRTTAALWGLPDDEAWERAHRPLPRAIRRASATSRTTAPLPLGRSSRRLPPHDARRVAC